MALIKCPECGKDISDKAGSCPQCGHLMTLSPAAEAVPQENAKKSNKKKFMIPVILSIVAVVVVVIALVIKFGGNKDYPNLIGKIHLDMTQDEVEEILKKEITEDLYITNSYTTGGNEIVICNAVNTNALDQMSFKTEHPDVYMICLHFDWAGNLQIVEMTVMESMQSTAEEFALGIKYKEMRRDGRDGKKRYAVLGKTRIEVEEWNYYKSISETSTRISYVRAEDVNE